MKFIDEIEITVRAGHGGAGCVSFLREKYRAHGGPDGGDGGRGGNLYLQANASMQSLGHILKQTTYAAPNGQPGRGHNRSGVHGEDLIIQLPMGTEVMDLETDEILCDLNHPETLFKIARGGVGGRGNQHFATSTNQTPEYAQKGLPGEEFQIILGLKLLADAGLVGLPNAGKSTLLAAVTHKIPRIADYAFTTLIPNIGVVEQPETFRRLQLADIPGIIEGAHKGQGLGLSFLRHIERVHLMIYVVDGANLNAAEEIKLLQNELRSYSARLIEHPAIVVINKIDQFDYDESFARESVQSILNDDFWKDSRGGIPEVFFISAREKRGTQNLIEHLFNYFPEKTLAERALESEDSQKQDAPDEPVVYKHEN